MSLSEKIYQAIREDDGYEILEYPVPMDSPEGEPWELVKYTGVWYRRRADGSQVVEIGPMSYPELSRLLEEEGYTAG